ncbi:MAG: hypothetical protein A3C03_00325 [Candidatus Colwellbacteria bacterium RIFCSPHIGHO2_02_FULL_45_17]|uniref:Uncharacterized protein n=2 Tax=Candidatus Colwelliibacteriota TaxID=1817904 RepID=A0A1G1ZBX4_9BACT|nr:MAG: hypothetical protein A3C03_00325 [Candidatus Colwellbacteria bacterium RIFCSPHIGHO2_02_FULL_45_17]OGY61584.1 MAG: hypothetical protein A3I33_00440 [Candidatus Colwellbacteria bacterium RIFCSPLOWO2_02_FULL_45_11]OGY62158.1 MAG: hypothetical protein A3G58_02320 [Candidatus Colwellbacteria bacterium RIFCSPLOWO2_12_FULL_46_17]
MSQKNYFVLSGTIFAIVFLLHALRLLNAWDVVIGSWQVPVWVSWFGVVVAGVLAWSAFKRNK